MKIKELMDELGKLNPDMEVMLQIDSEGNGYNQCAGADGDAIYKDGEMYSTVWSAEDCCLDEEEWKVMKEKEPRCAVLYPC